ncbi:Highly reducing polyketide synthase [Fulvia fulva]|uniref:Highly reducing polyketide synthase n=1 Tax=Passalora fulva TaxID=5499 RepID=A0A9Q8UT11_PASFU|nr:Highly reducing polyketide synthase [Fulvia fulva]KAK4619132.1 Highly reducing polyketide synthase [Fulvia fulva]UJO21310.1 Highly reducing polyketide synthase [Fulvia fulva]
MFIEDIDPKTFDAAFFGINKQAAVAMDPQQRQLLEVVYEALENAGIRLEDVNKKAIGTFVGSYAVDYADVRARDPTDRAPGVTVGVGRAILSNRISYFLNTQGPSMTIDTACSGSLVGLDVACRYLSNGEIDGAIVAAANIYLSPEHAMDTGVINGAMSITGRCHSFDARADGYIKAEAVNAVVIKRLADAIRDGDPIRAIIRGSATNNDGRTGGITAPSPEAQAVAIRNAYANAGITDLNETTYVECHGTGTQAGDPAEAQGVASVFSETRDPRRPLTIGSAKANIGHSEPAAGITGLIKAVLTLESDSIPGLPSLQTPNPQIDFEGSKLKISRDAIPWPEVQFRRASVNSFGYGGSNVHVVLDAPTHEQRQSFQFSHQSHYTGQLLDNGRPRERHQLLVLSANDAEALHRKFQALANHVLNPSVSIDMRSLSYTLSERRSHLFHRGFIVTDTTALDVGRLVTGKRRSKPPAIAFIYTGQGAQWPQQGKALLELYPQLTQLILDLDDVLAGLPHPPAWKLIDELTLPRTAEEVQRPELSQTLVTALQLALHHLLREWNVLPTAVLGHSSGEIAAAAAAGLITNAQAITLAYYRGYAAEGAAQSSGYGMLATGAGAVDVQPFLEGLEDSIRIACHNSAKSTTLSGRAAGVFARPLHVNVAYHSHFIGEVTSRYQELITPHLSEFDCQSAGPLMFSSLTGRIRDLEVDAHYWAKNMASIVRFDEALTQLVLDTNVSIDFLVEIGPSGALAGPVKQVLEQAGRHQDVTYTPAFARGKDAIRSLVECAGRAFIAGTDVNILRVNAIDERSRPAVLVDLPNYSWDRSQEYWYESESSADWRNRLHPHHELLGSKVLGTSWQEPTWKNTLRLQDLPWLADHRASRSPWLMMFRADIEAQIGSDILFPATGFIAMAIEAIQQQHEALTGLTSQTSLHGVRLRDVKFDRALPFLPGSDVRIRLTLRPRTGGKSEWHEYNIASFALEKWQEHSSGLIRRAHSEEASHYAEGAAAQPLDRPVPGTLWYKAMRDVGYNFGPSFRTQKAISAHIGQRRSRSLVSLQEPALQRPASRYLIHPAPFDGCIQSTAPAMWEGVRWHVNELLVPVSINDIFVSSQLTSSIDEARVEATADYSGAGRPESAKSHVYHVSVHDASSQQLVLQVSGLSHSIIERPPSVYDNHRYSQMHWKPDISFDRPVYKASSLSPMHEYIELILHKHSRLSVLEIVHAQDVAQSLWLDFPSKFREAASSFVLAVPGLDELIDFQTRYSTEPAVEDFVVIERTLEAMGASALTKRGNSKFDLVIYRSDLDRDAELVKSASRYVERGGYLLWSQEHAASLDTDHVRIDGHDSPQELGESHEKLTDDSTDTIRKANFETLRQVGLRRIQLDIPEILLRGSHTLWADDSESRLADVGGTLRLSALTQPGTAVDGLLDGLAQAGWIVVPDDQDLTERNSSPISLVIEAGEPILPDISKEDWSSLQQLLTSGVPILWVTEGSQLEAGKPHKALIHGLRRSAHAEDPSLELITLDVEQIDGPNTVSAVLEVLRRYQAGSLKGKGEDFEFAEREGAIYVPRVVPDAQLNTAAAERGRSGRGAPPIQKPFSSFDARVALHCERPGDLDSLTWQEEDVTVELATGTVEVEIMAVSLAFKDVAVAMGLVPENEHVMGLDGAGIVRRVAGSGVINLRPGQRVVVSGHGVLANRVIKPACRVCELPDWMTFEQVATTPFVTALYSLEGLARLRKGSRVLIHSASGALGAAVIQLCRVAQAEVFATVGSTEKKEFLTREYGIPEDHIFSSRDTAFAYGIQKITAGRGVDIVLNSLTGELLEESWRCIAEGGTFIELGKRDLLDRGYLPLHPFLRNSSYRCVDFGHREMPDELIGETLQKAVTLLDQGVLKPIEPVTVFGFDQISAAFRAMGGYHIGRVVVSRSADRDVVLPVRPGLRHLSLDSEAAYVLIGGLKGLNGGIAVQLALWGAKTLVVLGRSGYNDEKSQSVLRELELLSVRVVLIQGDIAEYSDARRCLDAAGPPIRGIIHAAMVLRDRVFASMTHDEYHQTLRSKVQGAWNLHRAAEELDLPLDFFTLFSSISGLIGQKGQANYAAANAFLDALADYRRVRGLPACSIDLGAVDDVGYMSEHVDLLKALDTNAWTPINQSLLHEILRFAIEQQDKDAQINPSSSAQLVTSISHRQKPGYGLLSDARFGALGRGQAGTDGAAADGIAAEAVEVRAFQTLIRNGPNSPTVSLQLAAVAAIKAQIAKILQSTQAIEEERSLGDYGIDSLAGVELRNWIRSRLGVEMSTIQVTQTPSLTALGSEVARLASRTVD